MVRSNNAIEDIRHTHDDREALFIDAIPPHVATFFRVKAWLVGIQHELDASWAVRGEFMAPYGAWTDSGWLSAAYGRLSMMWRRSRKWSPIFQ